MNTFITKSGEQFVRVQDKLSCRITRSDEVKSLDDGRYDVAPLDHRTHAYVATRKTLRDGTDDVVPDHLSDRPYVLRGQRVLVHERVHGRINVRRR